MSRLPGGRPPDARVTFPIPGMDKNGSRAYTFRALIQAEIRESRSPSLSGTPMVCARRHYTAWAVSDPYDPQFFILGVVL